jgi:hypothetical protein
MFTTGTIAMFKSILAATILVSAVTTIPAAAAVIDISASGDTTNVPFFQTTQTFTLGSIGNAKLNIVNLTADDLIVVSVNGTAIVGAGIFGPGNGNVFFTAGGPSTPYTFAYNNGAVNASFAAPFVVGANTVTLTVNNNNAGINTGNGGLTGGPGYYAISGTVTAVPEPAVWGLMIVGFGMVGVASRRRATVVVA